MSKLHLKLVLFFAFFFSLFICTTGISYGVDDPLALPNNKFGIHILFQYELPKAAELVNSNGGDWGYVIIPIQSGDRDLIKWQSFMDDAKRLHIIPIIRLATEGDYFNTKVWRRPSSSDVLDFANFLNSLEWPTKNRYIVVFNEPNRADEWGGSVNAAEYAQVLSYAVTVFKSKSPDFFIISAGMDNAAANTSFSMSNYDYLRAMQAGVPGIFNQIDGLGSHSYPNPAFAKPATVLGFMSIATFRYEKQLAESYAVKKLPVFITETGWSTERVSHTTAATYYKQAFAGAWQDPSLVTVIPFLLQGNGGPFTQFSFVNSDGTPHEEFLAVQSIEKTKGQPHVMPDTFRGQVRKLTTLPVRHFDKVLPPLESSMISISTVKFFAKILLRI